MNTPNPNPKEKNSSNVNPIRVTASQPVTPPTFVVAKCQPDVNQCQLFVNRCQPKPGRMSTECQLMSTKRHPPRPLPLGTVVRLHNRDTPAPLPARVRSLGQIVPANPGALLPP